MHEARMKAWATRRHRYGPRGHAGSYSRGFALGSVLARRAIALVVKLHREEVLSEGQCCKALDLDRVQFRVMCDETGPEGVSARQLREDK